MPVEISKPAEAPSPTSAQSFNIVLVNPQLLEDNCTLRFSIAVKLLGSDKLLGWMEGWRVLNGKLIAPARKAGKGYFPFWRFGSNRAEDVVIELVNEWKEKFPSVMFPSGGEFK